jgi:hypothetical protein
MKRAELWPVLATTENKSWLFRADIRYVFNGRYNLA